MDKKIEIEIDDDNLTKVWDYCELNRCHLSQLVNELIRNYVGEKDFKSDLPTGTWRNEC